VTPAEVDDLRAELVRTLAPKPAAGRPAPDAGRRLFVGDLHSRKRGNLVLKAFAHAVRPRFADARLTVIGPERCGGPGIDWKRKVDEQELIEEYRQAWVCCSASSYEGFGVPLIEAMASGVPVVTTSRACGSLHARPDSEFLVGDTAGDIARHLVRLLEDSTLRARLASGGGQAIRLRPAP
jgi:glycosyltransferase involved in cell wall biosynthesis